jgi:hypothetical protein
MCDAGKKCKEKINEIYNLSKWGFMCDAGKKCEEKNEYLLLISIFETCTN